MIWIAQVAMFKLTGWVVLWNPDSAKSFADHANKIDEAMVEYIEVDPTGLPVRRSVDDAQKASVMKAAKANHVKLFAMTSNYSKTFDPGRMSRMLDSESLRKQHIDGLIEIAIKDGFDGIDLDYESLHAADRDKFSKFVAECAKACHEKGLRLSAAVHPKTSEPGTWDGPQAQDWSELGRSLDVVRVMTYDNHWSDGDPGPIAPDAWVKDVMTFAKSVISASKLETGLCAYGYDWSKKPADSYTWTDFSAKFRSPYDLDSTSGELKKDKAWFGGFESASRKLKVTKELGLRGTAVWYIGSEQPEFWDLFKVKG